MQAPGAGTDSLRAAARLTSVIGAWETRHMRTGIAIVLASLFAAATACSGGSSSAPASSQAAEGHHEGAGHGEHHGAMPPELASFHDVLAPRWHAPEGEQRQKDTCTAIPDFQTNADAVAKAAPPAGADAGVWTLATTDLGARVDDLAAACQAGAAAQFQTAFSALHESFHRLMELAGGRK